MCPPDPAKAPFRELRQVVPVRLATDPWTPGFDDYASEFSVPSTPEDYLEEQPHLSY